ncbi:MAG: helix-turn-helix domain-containing protein [Candidatus Aenigmatarchaeota archaeon]
MQNASDSGENLQKLLSIGQASEYLGISIDTLRRWEKKGKLVSYRSPGGHRYFRKSDLDKLFGRKYERAVETQPRKRREIKTKDSIQQEAVTQEVLEEKISTGFQILDRPVREVIVPKTTPVRIIKEEIKSFTTFVEDQFSFIPHPNPQIQPSRSQSILEPPAVSSASANQYREILSEGTEKKIFLTTNQIVFIVILVTILILFVVVLLTVTRPSSQELLSPVAYFYQKSYQLKIEN